MPSEEDLRAGHAIAAWNIAHGAVLNEITRACDALAKACDADSKHPSAAAYANVRETGRALGTVSANALHGPWAGVSEFDEARRMGLECYLEAGQLASAIEDSEQGGERAEECAALLNKGTAIIARATKFTDALRHRLQRA